MSSKVQQVMYVIALLGLMAALAAGIFTDRKVGTGARSAGVSGSSRGS